MANCFDNIIALRGNCTDATPTSGLYINDIGITVDELNALITKDYASGEALFDAKLSFALKNVTNAIHTHFGGKYLASSVLDGQRMGYFQDNLSLIAGTADTSKGIWVEFCNDNSYVDLFVSELSLQVNFTGNVDVKVYDLYQNKLLDTLTVPTVAGEISTIYPHKTYKSNRKHLQVIFVYDTTAVSSYKTYLKQGGCTNCGTGSTYSNSWLTARAVTVLNADTKVRENLTQVGDTGGMSLIYGLSCNHSDWLCSHSNTIAMPVLYRTAAEIMEYGIHNSTRTNSNTMIDYDKMKERMEYYETKFGETFDNILGNMKPPQDKKCFQCNERTRHAVVLP
mgnify:CR=1 FL=1